MPQSSEWSLSFALSYQNLVHFSVLLYACNVPCPWRQPVSLLLIPSPSGIFLSQVKCQHSKLQPVSQKFVNHYCLLEHCLVGSSMKFILLYCSSTIM
jgi:hypothetical protein